MKSSHCRTRWHDRCALEIENADGSAFICECDCHAQPIKYDLPLRDETEDPIWVGGIIEPCPDWAGPPPHPLPFDHGKYRIAEEPPGTNPNLPWQSTRCVECREQVWAKNSRTIEREEAVCESCYYMTVSEHYEEMAKKQRRISLRFHNPFEL